MECFKKYSRVLPPPLPNIPLFTAITPLLITSDLSSPPYTTDGLLEQPLSYITDEYKKLAQHCEQMSIDDEISIF